MPEALGRQQFYDPPERGFEREIRKRLEYWAKLRKDTDDVKGFGCLRVVICCCLLTGGTAAAAEPAEGRWALGPFSCDGEAFTKPETPLIVQALSVRWYDANCSIVSNYKVNQTLYLQGRCNIAGRAETSRSCWNGCAAIGCASAGTASRSRRCSDAGERLIGAEAYFPALMNAKSDRSAACLTY